MSETISVGLPADWDWRQPNYGPVFDERITRLQRLRSKPEMWEGVRAYYREHPADFICDWGVTFDPRNKVRGLPVNLPFLLFPRQREYIEWLHDMWKGNREGIVEKSRDMGISWLCVSFAVWMWIFHDGTSVGFGSRKEEYVDTKGDPDSLFEKMRMFIDKLPTELRPEGYNPRLHATYMMMVNPSSGSTITGEAGDNIGRGGRKSIYFVDEAAYVERPMLIEASLSATTNCRIDVSTPNGSDNPFAEKRRAGQLPVFTFHWRQDPRKDEAWYLEQKRLKDKVIVAQELDINYEASTTNALIPGPLIEDAMSRGRADVNQAGWVRISVDVARFGNNETVITAVRGRACLYQKVYKTKDTVFVAGAVRACVLAFGEDNVSQIAIDDVGVGGGVTDQLKQWFPAITDGVNAASSAEDGLNFNLRARMYADLLEWLKNQPVSLPNDPELRAQLASIKYRFRGGLRILESKKEKASSDIANDVSRSPDRADSLALAFALPPRGPVDRAPAQEDPWAALDQEVGY